LDDYSFLLCGQRCHRDLFYKTRWEEHSGAFLVRKEFAWWLAGTSMVATTFAVE
jgi:hypothetical protein